MNATMEERKQIFIDVSIKLFSKNGFSGTSTSSIATYAAMNTGTLFHIFKSKDNLIKELFYYCKDQLLDATIKDYSDKDFIELSKEVWRNTLNFTLENYDTVKYLFIYYNSKYYKNQISEEDKKDIYEPIKNIVSNFNVHQETVIYETIIQFYISYGILIADKIISNVENKEIIKTNSEKLLINGLNAFSDN